MKATLPNYRQAPRKVRLVTNLIKGKKVVDADTELSFLVKRAAEPIQKLLKSAIANAEKQGLNKEDLYIKSVTVNKGTVLKRYMPRAFGRASQILKRSSHLEIELAVKEEKESKKKKVSKSKK